MKDENVKSRIIYKKITEVWLGCKSCETETNTMKLDRKNSDNLISLHKFVYKCMICQNEQYASGFYPYSKQKVGDEIDLNDIKNN